MGNAATKYGSVKYMYTHFVYRLAIHVYEWLF